MAKNKKPKKKQNKKVNKKGRQTKVEEAIKETKNPIIESEIILVLIIVLLLLLLIFSLFKIGSFGVIANNILAYLLSDFYVIPLLSLMGYIMYYLIKKEKLIKQLIGMLIISLSISLIISLLNSNITNINDYVSKLLINFSALLNQDSNFSGGIIGELLYIGFNVLIGDTGIIIIIVALFFISIFFLKASIP